MRHFKLIAQVQCERQPHIVEFQALEIGTALEMAAHLLEAPRAEMWCDGQLLCKLSRAGDREAPFWQVG